MRVLVLGGSLYMGAHLVENLLEAGHRVTIANRGQSPDPFGSRVAQLRLDRTDSQSVRTALTGQQFDWVFDNVAYSSIEVRDVLDCVSPARYILTSTVSVYPEMHGGILEAEMDTRHYPLRWVTRDAVTYDEMKRQAECALFQAYPGVSSAAVRLPLIMAKNDRSGRLSGYAHMIARGEPINIDNQDSRLDFIHAPDAGRFLNWLAGQPIEGPVNASGQGSATIGELVAAIERLCGRGAIISPEGAPAPLRGYTTYGLNTEKARTGGYRFEQISTWLEDTLSFYLSKQ